MTRVKRGITAHKRHKKLLKLTTGYRHGRRKLIRQAKQASLKAGQHAYRDRRRKKRDFRRLWIVQINAAIKPHEISYSQFIQGLTKAKIELNRKMLAELANKEPEEFSKIVEKAKSALK